ncbi:hypothetical protein CF327_g7489 [Tilletia walkeri]|nr:hypothetical protein CF327_g7489 [Tilletia walkeri]
MSSSTRSQASLLQETLDVALARLQALEDAQTISSQENLELRQRLEVQGPLQPPPAAPHNNNRELKVNSPETFHGRNKSKLGHFLLGLNIAIKTQSTRFPDDDTKINYAVSFLRDDAMAWVEPFASKTPEEQPAFMKSYHLFIKELKTIFGDPDEVATAERNIRLLRQRGPASAYFADFRRYAAVLDWNDSALASQAYPVPPEQARQLSSSEDSSIRASLPEPYHDYVDVFRKSSADQLPEPRSYDHKIPLQPETTPPCGPVYSLSEGEHQELRTYLKENLDKGFIRPSSSPAGAPVLFVPRPDGTFRMCVDYRGINNITIKDRYAIPKIDDLLDRIRGSTIFFKIDLRGAYNLLRIFEGEEWKTCFRTRYGSYEYLVMPFGLCNAPSSFQRFMNDIFRDMVDVFVVIYLDDILIFSKTAAEHEEHVKKVLERLRSTKLFAKAEKCEFSQESVEFLGYRLSKDGVTMVMDKVNSVLSWPEPKKVKELQSFLGFANFYRRFIWRYSEIVAPLTALLRKNTAWNWSEKCQDAFDTLKKAFTSAPVLQHFDPDEGYHSETDWNWIFGHMNADLRLESFSLGQGTEHLSELVPVQLWPHLLPSFGGMSLFFLPVDDWIVRHQELHLLRADAILSPHPGHALSVLQGTLLALEWGDMARQEGDLALWNAEDPLPFILTLPQVTARILVRGHHLDHGRNILHGRFRIVVALETSSFLSSTTL